MVDGTPISGAVPLLPGGFVRIGRTELLFRSMAVGAEQSTAAASPGNPVQPPRSSTTTLTREMLLNAMQRAQMGSVGRWLEGQRERRYWRVFVVGLVAYVFSALVLNGTGNPHLVPLVTLLASALVPVTFVIFCWGQGAFVDIPPTIAGYAFVSGTTVGVQAAAILEPAVVTGSGFGTGLLIGVCEETAKAAAVLWFIRDRRLRDELDGLVLGAAAGMGFAALETAGYGFSTFVQAFVAAAQQTGSIDGAYTFGIQTMLHVLNVRMALAVFGHGAWTAIICAALWRERRDAQLRITAGVVIAYLISVLLHALWYSADSPLLYIVYGLVGLIVLRFFILESLERAKLGPDAPPPPPLALALLSYVVHLFRQIRRPIVQSLVQVAAGTAYAASAPVPVRNDAAASAAGAANTVGDPPAARFCSNCGSPLAADARFCSRCGAGSGP